MSRGAAPPLSELEPKLYAADKVSDSGKGIKTVWVSKVPNGRIDDRMRFATTMTRVADPSTVDIATLPLVKFPPQSFDAQKGPSFSVELPNDEMLDFFQKLDTANSNLIKENLQTWQLTDDVHYHPLVKPPKEEKFKPLVAIKVNDPAMMEEDRKKYATKIFNVGADGDVTEGSVSDICKDTRCMIVGEIASMWFNPRRAEAGVKITALEVLCWENPGTAKRGLEAFPFEKPPKMAKPDPETGTEPDATA